MVRRDLAQPLGTWWTRRRLVALQRKPSVNLMITEIIIAIIIIIITRLISTIIPFSLSLCNSHSISHPDFTTSILMIFISILHTKNLRPRDMEMSYPIKSLLQVLERNVGFVAPKSARSRRDGVWKGPCLGPFDVCASSRLSSQDYLEFSLEQWSPVFMELQQPSTVWFCNSCNSPPKSVISIDSSKFEVGKRKSCLENFVAALEIRVPRWECCTWWSGRRPRFRSCLSLFAV